MSAYHHDRRCLAPWWYRVVRMKRKMPTHRRFKEVRLAKVSALMHSILFALINSSWERHNCDYS